MSRSHEHADRRRGSSGPRVLADLKVPGYVLTAILLAAAGWWWFTRPAGYDLSQTADRNVLLVTIDTLRADALSSYGGRAQTPNLDRLAARGARFTGAHANAVVTLVSHASILSGLYPYQTGVRDNIGYRVTPGTPTLATRLHASGFATGAFVGALPLTKRFGLTRGFDVYDDQIPEHTGAVDFALPERRADVVVSRALEWITAQESKKFFAWVHVFDPHAPYNPPDQWKAQYAGAPYQGEVAWTDAALGPLFDRLALLPKKTLVIVTADHGEGLGDHGELTHGMFAYESTLKVPLIIAEVDPKATSMTTGAVIASPARHVDLVPTVLDALGMAAETALAGTSLRGVMHDGGGPDRPSYFEAMTGLLSRGWAPLRGVLTGGDKFIDLPVAELYDLTADPGELRNQAAQQAARMGVLRNTLATFDTALPGAPQRESAAVSEQLRALGYTSGTGTAKTAFTENDDPKRLIDLDNALHQANELFVSGRAEDAIRQFEAVIAKRPDLVDAYRYMAFAYWQLGQPAAAIKTLETAITLRVADQDVLTRLGVFLAETGQAQKAIALLAKTPGDDPEALNSLGIAYGQAGRAADALATFQRVLTVDDTNGVALQNIGTIHLRQNNVAEAETWIRKAIAADPVLANAYTTLGVILSRQQRPDEAIDAWRRAVDLDGREFDALYNVTLALAQRGARDMAVSYGERFLATAPPAFYAADLASIRRLLGR